MIMLDLLLKKKKQQKNQPKTNEQTTHQIFK